MARVNISAVMKKSQEISRADNIKDRGAGPTKQSKKIQDELRRYIDKKAPTSKKEVLEYLYQRMVAEGDDFEKITNLGQYNELLIGIHLGLFKTEKDINSYEVFDDLEHEAAGDFTFIDSGVGKTDLQAKGMDASMRIPVGTKLVLGDTGRVIKDKSLDNFARSYVKSSPKDIRFGLPIFRNANRGFFDLGSETFLKLVKNYPGVFSFQLGKTAKDFKKYEILFKNPTKDLVEQLLKMTDSQLRAQSELGKIVKVRFGKDEQKLRALIEKKIQEKRLEAWYRWGTVRLSTYSPERIVEEVNPLINTGIMWGDSHQPFYDLLGKLFNSTSIGVLRTQYLRKSGTLANKLPDAYYEQTYHSIRY